MAFGSVQSTVVRRVNTRRAGHCGGLQPVVLGRYAVRRLFCSTAQLAHRRNRIVTLTEIPHRWQGGIWRWFAVASIFDQRWKDRENAITVRQIVNAAGMITAG